MSFRLQSPLWHLHPLGTKPSVSLGATQTSLGKNLLNSGREALIHLQWLKKKKKARIWFVCLFLSYLFQQQQKNGLYQGHSKLLLGRTKIKT